MTFDRTPKRLKVAAEIGRAEVRWYHFIQPEARNVVTDTVRTDTVSALADARIVDIGTAAAGSYSVPVLTNYGREWAGSGSTSPEPEPDICCKGIADGGGHAQWCSHSASPEPEPLACRRAEWCVLPDDGHSAWECSTGVAEREAPLNDLVSEPGPEGER